MLNGKNPGIENVTKVVDSQKENLPSPLSVENTTVLSEQVQVGDRVPTYVEDYNRMKKSIRSWTWWLVICTVISAVTSNTEWAIVLAIVALMSVYLYDVSGMYLVYAGLMLWASISNILLGGGGYWVSVGLIQLLFAGYAVREYLTYRSIGIVTNVDPQTKDLSTSISSNRGSHLAWISLLFGLIFLLSACSMISIGIVMQVTNNVDIFAGTWADTVSNLIIDLGILGLPVGVASLVSNQRHKAAAVTGIVLGLISVLLLIIGILLVYAI
jgi:hypothetical protein